jgi:hypothetical protein
MRRKEAGSSRTSMLRRARCAGHGEWRLDYRSSRSRCKQRANKQAAGSSTQRHGRQRQLPHPGHDAPRVASPARAVVLDVASKVPAPSAARPELEVGSPGPPAGSGRGPALQGALLAGAVQRQGRARLGRPGPFASAEKYRPGGQYPAATLMARYSPQPPCCGDGGGFRITAIP